jgi:hypothetical protein
VLSAFGIGLLTRTLAILGKQNTPTANEEHWVSIEHPLNCRCARRRVITIPSVNTQNRPYVIT